VYMTPSQQPIRSHPPSRQRLRLAAASYPPPPRAAPRITDPKVQLLRLMMPPTVAAGESASELLLRAATMVSSDCYAVAALVFLSVIVYRFLELHYAAVSSELASIATLAWPESHRCRAPPGRADTAARAPPCLLSSPLFALICRTGARGRTAAHPPVFTGEPVAGDITARAHRAPRMCRLLLLSGE
jgi:hypothetical protein